MADNLLKFPDKLDPQCPRVTITISGANTREITTLCVSQLWDCFPSRGTIKFREKQWHKMVVESLRKSYKVHDCP